MKVRHLLASVLFLLGCDDHAGNEKVLDALIVATDRVYAAVDEEGTWLVPVAAGSEVSGTLESGGGSLTVSGWRLSTDYEGDTYYAAYAEKLALTFVNWPEDDLVLSGQVKLSRHSLDVGPGAGAVDDASRTSVYQGNLTSTGTPTGTFAIDVHAMASGTLAWTCGTVNGIETGHGPCY